jgi:hypothetical protein
VVVVDQQYAPRFVESPDPAVRLAMAIEVEG